MNKSIKFEVQDKTGKNKTQCEEEKDECHPNSRGRHH